MDAVTVAPGDPPGERIARLETKVDGLTEDFREHRLTSERTLEEVRKIQSSLEYDRSSRAVRDAAREAERKAYGRVAAIGGGVAGGALSLLAANIKAVWAFITTVAR